MMDDILDFGFTHMVDNGRLSMWMPVANDEDMEIPIPSHPAMELVAMSIQQFNKCTFRLETIMWISMMLTISRRGPQTHHLPPRSRSSSGPRSTSKPREA
jgi:hypothetical protein